MRGLHVFLQKASKGLVFMEQPEKSMKEIKNSLFNRRA